MRPEIGHPPTGTAVERGWCTEMVKAEEFRLLERLRDQFGPLYGSETLCMLLHVLALREKPTQIIELGTGLGITTVWIAAALEINGAGSVVTIDDGSHFPPASLKHEQFRKIFYDIFPKTQDYNEYIESLLSKFSFSNRITYLNRALDFSSPDGLLQSLQLDRDREFDWAFCDVVHGPREVESCLAAFLSMAAPSFSLFVDSASTYTESFLVSERLVDQLRRSKIPEAFNEIEDSEAREKLRALIPTREFSVMHFIEQVTRSQNSTLLIKAYPVDSIPYPPTVMR